MSLANFTEHALALIRHKDVMKKQIVYIKPLSETEFEIQYKDKTVSLILNPELGEAAKGMVVCDNTKQNIEKCVLQWTQFIASQTSILFLNTKTGANWSVTPHIHQRILGSKDIRKGLKAIYANTL